MTNVKKKPSTQLISYKISPELCKKLQKYADTQTDEAGLELSPSLAARRLMLESLKRWLDK
jgi:hypothetical protein